MTVPDHLGVTRAAYDTVAVDYAEFVKSFTHPLNNAVLAAFAESVPTGPVADIGCGPGHNTAHLHSLGADACGIDLSPGMLAVARETYPHLRFHEGSMTGLDLADDTLAGILAWYSIIHLPPGALPTAFAEFHRVLKPGGYVLLAFQVGDEHVRLEQAYGHSVAYDVYRLSPDKITELLNQAGLTITVRLERDAAGLEATPQAFLFAKKA